MNPEALKEIKAQNAWRGICAKLGQPDAGEIRAGGTDDELHEKRKTMRRALNKVIEHVGVRDMAEDEALAMNHAATIIASIDSMLDGIEQLEGGMGGAKNSTGWRNAKGQPMKVLRNAADIDGYYRGKAANSRSDGVTLGDFFRGVANMPTTTAVRNALSEGTNTSGGFTLPSVVMPQILNALVPASSLLQAGMPVIPLNDGAKSYTTAIVSGVPTAAWRAENGAVAESDPVFSASQAVPQSLSFFFKISRELLADSPNIEQALLTAIGQAMAKELDRAGLRGTGTAPQPRGILNTAGIQSITNGTNGASPTSYANLLSAVQALLNADAPMPTAAIMAPRSLVKFAGLADSTGQPLSRPSLIADLPMLSTSQIPTNLAVGTSSDCTEIYLGDFTKMALMLRESLSVQLLSETFAGNGQLAFMCHCRADFAVLYPAAFAVITGIKA